MNQINSKIITRFFYHSFELLVINAAIFIFVSFKQNLWTLLNLLSQLFRHSLHVFKNYLISLVAVKIIKSRFMLIFIVFYILNQISFTSLKVIRILKAYFEIAFLSLSTFLIISLIYLGSIAYPRLFMAYTIESESIYPTSKLNYPYFYYQKVSKSP